MTLRTYLRFLRPVTLFLFVIVLVEGIFPRSQDPLTGLDGTTSWLLGFSLTLGFIVAGAAHEPMHRPFFLLLPDGRRRLRKVTLLAVAACALTVTGVVALIEPSIPPLASLGLAAGLIALPCIDRHTLFGASIGWCVASSGLLIFSCLPVSRLLRPAMTAAPWAFFFGGCALAAASLAWGFSRRHLRQRAETPYLSLQSMISSYLFDSRFRARWNEEVALYRLRRAQKTPPVERDWPVRSVGSSTLAGMKVVWHAFAGQRQCRNFFTFQFPIVVPVIVGALLVPIGYQIALVPFSTWADFWQSLADLTATVPLHAKPHAVGFAVWGGLVQAGAALLSLALIVPPQLVHPISRARLARVAFGLTLAQLFVAWVVPGAAIFFLSLIGQIASGLFGPGFGLRSIVEVDLALAVCLPLLACADSFRFFAVRLLLGVPIGFGTLAVATTHSLWNRYVLTIPGCLLTALVIATSLGLLWLRLRHRYRTCDLIADPGARFA